MNYTMLRNLRDNLEKKTNRSQEEEKLLQELRSLRVILDKTDFSLALSSGVCKSCGRPLN